MAFLRCALCNVDIHESFFVAHKKSCTQEPEKPSTPTSSGFSWVTSNLKRYFSPGGTSNQGGRPLKRLKTTPTSFAPNRSTRSTTPTGRSSSPAVFRVSNTPFARPRSRDSSPFNSSPFNAPTPNCTPFQPPQYESLPPDDEITLSDIRGNWQQHLARLSMSVTESYTKNPDWDDRFWDAIAYPSVVYLLPFLQTLKIYEFDVSEMANDICIMQFDITFGFDESRRLPTLNMENYWHLVKRLKKLLGNNEFRLQGKYCSNISFDRETHEDRRRNNFFSREWTHEGDSFSSTVALATHLHSLTPELPFKWTDVLRIWLRFANKKIYDEEVEKDQQIAEPVNMEEKDSEYEPETQEEEDEDSDEEESEPIPADVLKKIQDDYYQYKEHWKKKQSKKQNETESTKI